MPFHPFAVEQFLSENEQGVDYNFSESGVEPVRLGELLELAGLQPDALNDVSFHYPQVNGELPLRQRIADLYDGADADHVLVTVGASEANGLIAATVLEAGDEVVAMAPTYLQFAGNAQNRGVEVKPVPLIEDAGWALDVDRLTAAIGPATKVVSVVNPHNPTGSILSEEAMSAIIEAADSVGAWILADEVYAGAERSRNQPTPSFWGRYERTIAVNSMSKAYGLPGLRCGWVVAPPTMIDALWRRHEYATISATMLSNKLAAIALEPTVRAQLIARTRRLIRDGFDLLGDRLAHHPGVFSVVPPEASAMSFVRYDLPVASRDLALRLRSEQSVLVIPGDCFGMEHHFRVSSALPPDYLGAGLDRLNDLVGTMLGEQIG